MGQVDVVTGRDYNCAVHLECGLNVKRLAQSFSENSNGRLKYHVRQLQPEQKHRKIVVDPTSLMQQDATIKEFRILDDDVNAVLAFTRSETAGCC